MSKQMLTFEAPEQPTLAQAAAHLGVSSDALDASFGVLLIDPARGLYTVLVEESALPTSLPSGASGPFSNPKIAPIDVTTRAPSAPPTPDSDPDDPST
jgi:hypothetical protein